MNLKQIKSMGNFIYAREFYVLKCALTRTDSDEIYKWRLINTISFSKG